MVQLDYRPAGLEGSLREEPSIEEKRRAPPSLKHHRRLRVVYVVAMLWTQFSAIVVFTAIFQTTFNYAYLFYHRNDDELQLSYLDVVVREWNSRSSTCYFNALAQTVANLLQFISLFFA